MKDTGANVLTAVGVKFQIRNKGRNGNADAEGNDVLGGKPVKVRKDSCSD